MLWYYAQNNERKGPVDDAEIRRLAAAGILHPEDLVWNQTMGNEWRIASTVPELFASPPQLAGVAAEAPLPPGTGGRTPNRELTARARASLSGKWGTVIGFVVLYLLLSVLISLVGACVPFGSLLANLIVGGPLALGAIGFSITIARGQTAGMDLLFAGFRRMWPAMGAIALIMIFTALWLLLSLLPFILWFVILLVGQRLRLENLPDDSAALWSLLGPHIAVFVLAGIVYMVAMTVLALRYSQTLYVLWDNPDIGPLEAVRRSVAMMRGRKGKLFLLGLRFIGWAFLAMLTCGIGFLWLIPYMMISYAHFYDDLRT